MSCWADKLPISTRHIVSSSPAAPISSPSPFRFSEGHWRETGSCWGLGEGRLQLEASGQAGATSGGVAVDVGIHVIYRTQVLALICIQSLAVIWCWSPRPPLTLPWADQMLDFSNSCFRSMCFKKIQLLSFGTQWLSRNHGLLLRNSQLGVEANGKSHAFLKALPWYPQSLLFSWHPAVVGWL